MLSTHKQNYEDPKAA